MAEPNLFLKLARLSKRWSQSELAHAAGTSRQVINTIERGLSQPSLDTCLRICWALDKSLDELFWLDQDISSIAVLRPKRRGASSLQVARTAMRLSKSKLGATIGTSREVIRLIENGDYNPSLSLCLRLCWALDKTLDELFWRDKPEIWA